MVAAERWTRGGGRAQRPSERCRALSLYQFNSFSVSPHHHIITAGHPHILCPPYTSPAATLVTSTTDRFPAFSSTQVFLLDSLLLPCPVSSPCRAVLPSVPPTRALRVMPPMILLI